jgi:hypothetical protein
VEVRFRFQYVEDVARRIETWERSMTVAVLPEEGELFALSALDGHTARVESVTTLAGVKPCVTLTDVRGSGLGDAVRREHRQRLERTGWRSVE